MQHLLKKIILLSFFITTINQSFVFAYQTQLIEDSSDYSSHFQDCPVKGKSVLSCPTYRQTTDYTCGPAAVMVVMKYYGKLKASDFNQKTELGIAHSMSATAAEDGGTTQDQLVSWLSSHGFRVDSGQNVSTDMIMDNINKRIPVIVGFNGHWMVAKGYNKADKQAQRDQDEIIFSDSCCDVSVISRDDIDSTWQVSHMRNRGCNGNGEYIIAVPAR